MLGCFARIILWLLLFTFDSNCLEAYHLMAYIPDENGWYNSETEEESECWYVTTAYHIACHNEIWLVDSETEEESDSGLPITSLDTEMCMVDALATGLLESSEDVSGVSWDTKEQGYRSRCQGDSKRFSAFPKRTRNQYSPS